MVNEVLTDAGISGVCDHIAVLPDDKSERFDDMVHFDRKELYPLDRKRLVEIYRLEFYCRMLSCRQLREIGPDKVIEYVVHYLRHNVFRRIDRERMVPERKHEIGEYRQILDMIEVAVGDNDVFYCKELVHVE